MNSKKLFEFSIGRSFVWSAHRLIGRSSVRTGRSQSTNSTDSLDILIAAAAVRVVGMSYRELRYLPKIKTSTYRLNRKRIPSPIPPHPISWRSRFSLPTYFLLNSHTEYRIRLIFIHRVSKISNIKYRISNIKNQTSNSIEHRACDNYCSSRFDTHHQDYY